MAADGPTITIEVDGYQRECRMSLAGTLMQMNSIATRRGAAHIDLVIALRGTSRSQVIGTMCI